MKVFVYGTLMRGEPNHRLLSKAKFLGEARTTSKYTLLDLGWYPAMIEGGETSVVGEVYEVDEVTLAALDRLEGHPSFYRRQVIWLADGEEVESYLLLREKTRGWQEIPGGDWSCRI